MHMKSITSSQFYSVLENSNFNKFKIRAAKRTGNIKIEIAPSIMYKNGWKSKPVEYTIGVTEGIGYWIRRQNNCGWTFPLHYNRNSGKYGFETFEEAVTHLEKLLVKKYL